MLSESVQAVPVSLPAPAPRLSWRIATLIGLFSAELLVISRYTPHVALQDAPGLAGLVFSLGAWKARLLVTLAIVGVLLWQSRAQRGVQSVSAQPLDSGLAWRWLSTHLVSILLFAGLTFVLFEDRPQSILAGNVLVIAWIAAGFAALVSAAYAFLPHAFWKEVLRGTSDAWAYLLVFGAGACAVAAYAMPIWNPLARWTLLLAWVLLRPFVPGVTADVSTLTFGTSRFQVEVAPACSGYEGIGLILVFTTAWLWFFRRDWLFPRALLLIPAGVVAIWIFNAIRVAALVMIGVAGAPDIALQGFHSHAGWISFNVVALGTCLLARRIAWLSAVPSHSGGTAALERSEPNPITPYLLPFLAILAAGMLAGAASHGFEWLYPLRVAAAAAALWYFRDRYRGLDWRIGWPAVGLGALVFLIWIGLEPLSGSAHAAQPLELANASTFARVAWLAVRILGAVVTVPIAEELAFRGFLLRRLISADFESVAWRTFAWAPFLISSIAFGLLHGDRWLAGIVAGMVYAYAMLRRGRIGEAVAAHAVTNALLAIYVLTSGNWQLW